MKNRTEFKQTAKVGVAGSFFNQLMSNNSSRPEVGKGATEMKYTDRGCYEVIEVSKDLKTVKLERLSAKADNSKGALEMGHQDWVLEPTGYFETVVWRHNKWRREAGFIDGKKVYATINIIFGRKDYYYDWSF